ncbi:hypothetical protein CB0940_07786 [Cercospora beticola]|uniref:Uncharacterized protein n=1 Tax=Cercospora beticola TaxID=122368 RepID=A0A2G5H9I4_CERBT|nr:hypothetical protein CB0940_07786 [Cercospora beticola]PIA89181.1 hypothetical protein CB0940_07786 [Cercospora beticola]WPB03754.1 hypothetical protein RHO25_008398 [Cercospora beticola]
MLRMQQRQNSLTVILVYLSFFLNLVLAAYHEQEPLLQHNTFPSNNESDSTTTMSKSLNVFKQPLALHSTSPMTGFLRNGYCEVPGADFGNHAVAAEVTDEFLDFTARQGNDLRSIGGMKAGCKWCLCASRWLEAFEARTREPAGDKIVPKIYLKATNEKALNKIKLEDLKAFAVDKD